MVWHEERSAGLHLADPTSPIPPPHCVVIILLHQSVELSVKYLVSGEDMIPQRIPHSSPEY